jgi:hypothetical protein
MDDKTPAPAEAPVDELQRTIALALEHNRKGYDILSLLFHAQKLVGQLADNPGAAAVIAGYQMTNSPRVFYPADWKPTDINNFQTLVYAPADAANPPEPHYVLRYVERVGGPLGTDHALVSVRDWDAGMSRAVAEQVCDSDGKPLVVFPGPVANAPAESSACR